MTFNKNTGQGFLYVHIKIILWQLFRRDVTHRAAVAESLSVDAAREVQAPLTSGARVLPVHETLGRLRDAHTCNDRCEMTSHDIQTHRYMMSLRFTTWSA